MRSRERETRRLKDRQRKKETDRLRVRLRETERGTHAQILTVSESYRQRQI